MKKNVDIAIIGGGFFGLYIAEYFAKVGKKVILIEKENDLMQRASYINQARVHNGYHYPRSILTALRSRISFPRFVDEFEDCIESDFDKYYMISNQLGKVTPNQFQKFCQRIGAPCDPAPNHIKDLTNPKLIHGIFKTKEYAFNSETLKDRMLDRLKNKNVEILLNHETLSIEYSKEQSKIKLCVEHNESVVEISAQQVFNCTYSMLNSVLRNSNLSLIPLRHEMTEMCIVDVPDEIKDIAITVMCGPFFSTMPFPSKNAYSFSHVRYTPHHEWTDTDDMYINAHDHFSSARKQSAWRKMQLDAKRYIPLLADLKYKESLWEVKTILPRSDSDDSRPILFKANYIIPGLHCVMGGKIDNVYDAIQKIIELGLDK